jgi:hypothetical protein
MASAFKRHYARRGGVFALAAKPHAPAGATWRAEGEGMGDSGEGASKASTRSPEASGGAAAGTDPQGGESRI